MQRKYAMSEWNVVEDYPFEFEPESLVLDMGCGYGRQMETLNQRGCSTIGIDLDASRGQSKSH
jgi:cyclopropane fatty-acyl-phospholipid synthase-like methyltransferase